MNDSYTQLAHQQCSSVSSYLVFFLAHRESAKATSHSTNQRLTAARECVLKYPRGMWQRPTPHMGGYSEGSVALNRYLNLGKYLLISKPTSSPTFYCSVAGACSSRTLPSQSIPDRGAMPEEDELHTLVYEQQNEIEQLTEVQTHRLRFVKLTLI